MSRRLCCLLALFGAVWLGLRSQSLTRYEYWTDADYTMRTAVAGGGEDVSFTLSLAILSKGVHYLNFRAANATEGWGAVHRYIFYVAETASSAATIDRYEYWLDGDYAAHVSARAPQSGNIAITKDISSLAHGVHFFNYRSHNSDGLWGPINRYIFYVAETASPAAVIDRCEYWLDGDYAAHVSARAPQSGNIAITQDISRLAHGVHFFNFRSMGSDGLWGPLSRYIFYIGDDENRLQPITGYRYAFNGIATEVKTAPTEAVEWTDKVFAIPDAKDILNVEDGVLTFDGDSVRMSRTADVTFSLQFTDQKGRASSQIAKSFPMSDNISKPVRQLAMQRSVTFAKLRHGDYEALHFDIATASTYYLKASQNCSLQIYRDGKKYGTAIGGSDLRQTYAVSLTAGTYHAVVYNTVTDAGNADSDVSIKLMLTDNSVPRPEICFEDETITMTCAEPEAAIHYTLDGSAPTADSPLYTAPFPLAHNATVKAVAVMSGVNDSDVATLRIDSYKAEAPTIVFTNLRLYMQTSTAGARIYYTLDGSDPTTSAGVLYTEPVAVTGDAMVKAVARRDGYNDSDITTTAIDVRNISCVAPTIAKLSDGTLSMTTLTDAARIYYTLDGSAPTTASTLYTAPVRPPHNVTVKAIATHDGYIASAVTEYAVDWFRAERPTFSLSADNLLSITSATPGAVIYYHIGEGSPDVLYKAPVPLTDNRAVVAQARADGYNDSETATYTPGGFVCADVTIAYDGRYATLATATPGATIYYSTDNLDPASVYSGRFDVGGLCTLRAMAKKKDTNDSGITQLSVCDYFDGLTATVASGGSLAHALSWADGGKTLVNLAVTGTATEADLATLRTLAALRHLDISTLSLPGEKLPDRVFAAMGLWSVSLPATLSATGTALFADCRQLASVKWNAQMVLPAAALQGVSNPNLLLFTTLKAYTPAAVTNVVVNGVAERVVLSDTPEGSPYYCPEPFTAKHIEYSRTFSQQTIIGQCAGWEGIALPFDVQSVSHATKGRITPFGNEDSDKHFWLYAMSETGVFERATTIAAHQPYIISMPCNAEYIDGYNLGGGMITFAADNVKVGHTESKETHRDASTAFVPAFQSVPQHVGVMPVNVGEEYDGRLPGSVFVPGLRAVRPFEAYLRADGAAMARAINIEFALGHTVGIGDIPMLSSSLRAWGSCGVLHIETGRPSAVRVYDAGGKLVRTVWCLPGITHVRGLAEGIYIVCGQQVLLCR